MAQEAGEMSDKGLRKVDFMYLLRWSKVVTVFSSYGVTQQSIHKAIRTEIEKTEKGSIPNC